MLISRIILSFIRFQLHTIWRKILTRENIDEFLSIRQHFPHQNFPLIIFCRLSAGSLFAQGVIDSTRAMRNFSLSKCSYINGKTVVHSYARQLLAFQTDQQSCFITCDRICENRPWGHIHIILFYCIIVM